MASEALHLLTRQVVREIRRQLGAEPVAGKMAKHRAIDGPDATHERLQKDRDSRKEEDSPPGFNGPKMASLCVPCPPLPAKRHAAGRSSDLQTHPPATAYSQA